MVGVALLAGGYGETKTEVLYHEDGSKSRETPWVDGKKHGTEIHYHKYGSKKTEIVYENGEVISSKRY